MDERDEKHSEQDICDSVKGSRAGRSPAIRASCEPEMPIMPMHANEGQTPPNTKWRSMNDASSKSLQDHSSDLQN